MEWFKERRYKHVDHPVGELFAEKVMDPTFVSKHAFSPLIHFDKERKKYKAKDHKTVTKPRPINMPSHRDACIYSYYAALLSEPLEAFYKAEGLLDKPIAYRKLGRANYDYSAEVLEYAKGHSPCSIICVDVSSFFDTLDHKLLKERLKRILGVEKLSDDWYAVFRSVTKFHSIELDHITAFADLAERAKPGGGHPLATIADLKARGITISPNPTPGKAIPQGTPISAILANLYMIDFDRTMRDACADIGALYRRYSDDILVVCPNDKVDSMLALLTRAIEKDRLTISEPKTEITKFDPTKELEDGHRCAQYLGFTFYPGGAGIRPGSMSRHWQKMRATVKHLKRLAKYLPSDQPIYMKKVRKRFGPVNARNFSRYARRSAEAFGDDTKIKRQVKRAERWMHEQLKDIKASHPGVQSKNAGNDASLS